MAVLEDAVDLLISRVVTLDMPDDTPEAVQDKVFQIERACAVLQAGIDLQSQRYDDRVREADQQDLENETLRVKLNDLERQVQENFDRRVQSGIAGGPTQLDVDELMQENEKLSQLLADSRQGRERQDNAIILLEDTVRTKVAEVLQAQEEATRFRRMYEDAQTELKGLRLEADEQARRNRGHHGNDPCLEQIT